MIDLPVVDQQGKLVGLVILWIAAIVSAAVDNIPFTIAMVPIIQRLAAVGVPVSPLWWALSRIWWKRHTTGGHSQ